MSAQITLDFDPIPALIQEIRALERPMDEKVRSRYWELQDLLHKALESETPRHLGEYWIARNWLRISRDLQDRDEALEEIRARAKVITYDEATKEEYLLPGMTKTKGKPRTKPQKKGCKK